MYHLHYTDLLKCHFVFQYFVNIVKEKWQSNKSRTSSGTTSQGIRIWIISPYKEPQLTETFPGEKHMYESCCKHIHETYICNYMKMGAGRQKSKQLLMWRLQLWGAFTSSISKQVHVAVYKSSLFLIVHFNKYFFNNYPKINYSPDRSSFGEKVNEFSLYRDSIYSFYVKNDCFYS